jgi:hypothetical protein
VITVHLLDSFAGPTKGPDPIGVGPLAFEQVGDPAEGLKGLYAGQASQPTR